MSTFCLTKKWSKKDADAKKELKSSVENIKRMPSADLKQSNRLRFSGFITRFLNALFHVGLKLASNE